MKTDHDFLLELYGFLNKRRCITMEDASLNDMVQRYQNPPLTALNRVAMQMTVNEYNELGQLMKDIEAHLNAPAADMPIEATIYDEG